jgi:hypothetical protein
MSICCPAGHEKTKPNKPNSKLIIFSPQIYLGVINWFEKTKPNFFEFSKKM